MLALMIQVDCLPIPNATPSQPTLSKYPRFSTALEDVIETSTPHLDKSVSLPDAEVILECVWTDY